MYISVIVRIIYGSIKVYYNGTFCECLEVVLDRFWAATERTQLEADGKEGIFGKVPVGIHTYSIATIAKNRHAFSARVLRDLLLKYEPPEPPSALSSAIQQACFRHLSRTTFQLYNYPRSAIETKNHL